MRWLIMFLSLGAAVVLEQALPAWQLGGQTRPPVLLCVVMYYALNYSHIVALAIALLAGVLADAIAGLPLGSASLTFALLAVAVNRNRDFVFIHQWLTHMVLGAAASAAVILIMYIVLSLRLEQMRTITPAMVIHKMAGMAAQGMLLMPLIFMAMEAFEKMTGCRRSFSENERGIFNQA
jgi:rod shape-determining protein MreD